MEYGTIKIPEGEYKTHNERRKEMGLTWSEYIDGEQPDGYGEQIAMLKNDVMKLSDELAEARGMIDDLQAQLPKDVATELER